MQVAQDALAGFAPTFQAAWLETFRAKLGLAGAEEADATLIQDLLSCMAAQATDFTLTFRALATDVAATRALFADPAALDGWLAAWQARRARAGRDDAAMRAANPAFIPRNHLVEEAIAAAVTRSDFAPFETLVQILSRPFEDQPDHPRHSLPARLEERVLATFCGT